MMATAENTCPGSSVGGQTRSRIPCHVEPSHPLSCSLRIWTASFPPPTGRRSGARWRPTPGCARVLESLRTVTLAVRRTVEAEAERADFRGWRTG